MSAARGSSLERDESSGGNWTLAGIWPPSWEDAVNHPYSRSDGRPIGGGASYDGRPVSVCRVTTNDAAPGLVTASSAIATALAPSLRASAGRDTTTWHGSLGKVSPNPCISDASNQWDSRLVSRSFAQRRCRSTPATSKRRRVIEALARRAEHLGDTATPLDYVDGLTLHVDGR